MRCVVVRLSALGDVVLTTGVLQYLHAQYGFTFSVITRAIYAPFFERFSFVTKVHLLPVDIPFFSFLNTAKKLAIQYQDTPLLDLHDTIRTKILRFFWKAPVFVYPKYGKERRKFLATRDTEARNSLLQYTVPQRYCLGGLSIVGFQKCVQEENSSERGFHTHEELRKKTLPASYVLKPVIPYKATEESCCKKLQFPTGSSKVIALHPYAKHATKMWSPSSWDTLIGYLHQKGYQCIILGKSSKVYHHEMIDILYNYTNRTSIEETIALIRAAHLLVSADSGLMHIASATNTPVVALFGPTVQEWGFFPEQPARVLQDTTLECRPCSLHGKSLCRYHHECMQHIEPAIVLHAVEELLQQGQE